LTSANTLVSPAPHIWRTMSARSTTAFHHSVSTAADSIETKYRSWRLGLICCISAGVVTTLLLPGPVTALLPITSVLALGLVTCQENAELAERRFASRLEVIRIVRSMPQKVEEESAKGAATTR